MRHLASTSCSLVCASSSSRCLSCSFSPSFSSSSGSVDVLSLPGDDAWRDPRVQNRSLQCSQPITLLCTGTQTHRCVSRGWWVNLLHTLSPDAKNTFIYSVFCLCASIMPFWRPCDQNGGWIFCAWGLKTCDSSFCFDFDFCLVARTSQADTLLL